MKFITSILTAVSFAAISFGQSVQIGAPPSLSSITPGGPISVQINRPSFNSQALELELAIGIWPCGTEPCPGSDSGAVLGTILYNGTFTPKQPVGVYPPIPPNQVFNTTVPDWLPSGPAQLTVAHFSLVGASNTPFFEIVSEELIVV